MRITVPTILAALLTSTVTSIAATDNQSLPLRKAGFWEQKTVMDEGTGPRQEQVLKICIGEAMEANTARGAILEHQQKCEQYEIKKEGDATVVDMSCKYDNRHVHSRTEMTGDFVKSFNVKIESSTSDSKDAATQTILVKRTITQSGSYLSESCGDLKPGEALAPDGAKVTIQ